MSQRPILVIGGAGFIGSNVAHHFGTRGRRVRVLDDLSRAGVEENLAWLTTELDDRLEVRIGDVRDRDLLHHAVADAEAVFHFAAQVAATTSMDDPRHDFEVNARGTFEVLEALRAMREPPPLVYASTHKVYGALPDVPLEIEGDRWRPVDRRLAERGIDERRPLDLRTPHACSKGCADQYVLDYAKSFGLHALVLRTSCVYGPRQLGTEQQGWLAHFLISAIQGQPITLYGDGRQVRDVLYIDDLVEAVQLAWTHIRWLRGRAFNVGGGPPNTLSLLELLAMIGELRERRPDVRYGEWRAGDQRYYVSDTTTFTAATGWTPRTEPRAGVAALHGWLAQHRRFTAHVLERKEGALHV